MSLHDLHRPLGNTGLIVSPLGLGTVKLGRDQGVKYPNGFTIPDDAAARALLDQARALGINLIDTAPAYGVSEQRLGPLLRGQREDWVIVSKVGEEFENGQSRFDFSPAHTRLSVERSLQRLETDRIDLVLVHSDGNDVAILRDSGVYETLAELKRECQVRLVTDSQYVMQGIQEWMPNWKKRGWKTAAKQPVKNVDLWQQLDEQVNRHQITWQWVRGHTGHPGNERADQLANRGVDELKTR